MPEAVPYTIPVPAELDALIQKRMQTGGFNSKSEYVRSAIRADLERAAKQQLEQHLLTALDRGDYQDAPTVLQDLRDYIAGQD